MNLSSQEFFFSYRIINVIQKKKKHSRVFVCVYIQATFYKSFCVEYGNFSFVLQLQIFPDHTTWSTLYLRLTETEKEREKESFS